MRHPRSLTRLWLLAMGMLSLLGGVLAGLARLSWSVPDIAALSAGWHAALMISAFFGTVISLERAVAISRWWGYLAPAMAGSGGLLLLAGAPSLSAQVLFIMAATTLLAASGYVLRRLVAPFTLVLASAAACWLIGNLTWLATGRLSAAIPWWLSFLVLTIAGERLELTRFLATPRLAQRIFLVNVGTIVCGDVLSFWQEDVGLRVFALGLLALAVWLLRYDLARRNARQKGLARFIAISLLSGYVWLMMAGLLGLAGGFLPGHPWRDAALHAVGLGFVFSMVLGHAPIIFPAVARVKIPYHPVFYLPLLLLHFSLAWRVADSLNGDVFLRRQGGLANAIALLIFVLTMIASVAFGKQNGRGEA